MNIGYKGFEKGLQCRNEIFEVGVIYKKEDIICPQLCTNQGYHYCKTLKGVFPYYYNSSSNVFCEIEVLGNKTETDNKCITTSFRIIKILTQEEIAEILATEIHNLGIVEELQKQHPEIIIGGSTALFLHGIQLKREHNSDIDIIIPYYIELSDDLVDIDEDSERSGGTNSDFDFGGVYCGKIQCNSLVKIDCRIDPKQRYTIIEYEGVKYKVSNIDPILRAKYKYANMPGKSQKKHRTDLIEIATKYPKYQNYLFNNTP